MGLLDFRGMRWLQRSRRARRWLQRRTWNARWKAERFDAGWRLDAVDPVLAAAVEDGWIPGDARILDVGCGDGLQAHWLGQRGFRVLGIDIAEPAIRLARERFESEAVRFEVLDICLASPPGGPFDVILDRGCFHQILAGDRAAMVTNLLRAAADDARILLLARGFTGPSEIALTPEELGADRRQAVTQAVRDAFAPACEVVGVAACRFDPENDRAPGWAFRLQRVSR